MIKQPKVIEGMWLLISTNFLGPEEAAEDGVVGDDGAAYNKEDGSGLGEVDVNTGVAAE